MLPTLLLVKSLIWRLTTDARDVAVFPSLTGFKKHLPYLLVLPPDLD